MKFAVVIFAVVAAASAQFPAPFRYNPGQFNPGQYNPGQYNPGQYNKLARKPATYPFVSTTPAPLAFAPTFAPIAPTYAPIASKITYNGNEQSASILRQDNQVNPDGSYSYFYETDNGISAQESGSLKSSGPNEPPAIAANGGYRFTSPEGVVIDISYIADENGFQASGAAIPTPPPVPRAIEQALAYIAANPPRGQ